jgi:hypothetical protein
MAGFQLSEIAPGKQKKNHTSLVLDEEVFPSAFISVPFSRSSGI